jgi:Holliday junction DNA helicase RuvA
MIYSLKGVLAEALPTQAVVEVGGVGYLLLIPLSSFDKLPLPGEQVHMLTQLVVREDSHTLYGFITEEERDLFKMLLHHVTGIGPKLALSILSGMAVSRFKAAVVEGDVASLSKISGLGKKTAERIVLELTDKVGVAAAWQAASDKVAAAQGGAEINDAVLALIALGYKQVEAHKAVRAAADDPGGKGADAGELIKRALKKLV